MNVKLSGCRTGNLVFSEKSLCCGKSNAGRQDVIIYCTVRQDDTVINDAADEMFFVMFYFHTVSQCLHRPLLC